MIASDHAVFEGHLAIVIVPDSATVIVSTQVIVSSRVIQDLAISIQRLSIVIVHHPTRVISALVRVDHTVDNRWAGLFAKYSASIGAQAILDGHPFEHRVTSLLTTEKEASSTVLHINNTSIWSVR